MKKEDLLKRDILSGEDEIVPLSRHLEVSKPDEMVKYESDAVILEEFFTTLDLSEKKTVNEIAAAVGLSAKSFLDRVNHPKYRHALFARMQSLLDAGRLIWLHNLLFEAISDPGKAALQRVVSPLLGFTTDKTMNLNLQAQIDAHRDNLPETPEEKQRYIAGILIDTGFTPEEYEALYNERMYGR